MTEKLEEMLPEGFTSVDQFLDFYHERIMYQKPVSEELCETFRNMQNYVSSNGKGISQDYLDTIESISSLLESRY